MKALRRLLAPALCAAALTLVGCSSGTNGARTEPSDGAADSSRTLVVYAAASMEPTFTELAAKFEEDNPGVTVQFNFAGSQTLQEQIVEGAPADVFASANEKQMQPVVDSGLALSTPVVYATNELTIATPAQNPAHVESFGDLARNDVVLVICAPDVPCGAATQKIVEATGIELHPVSEEQSVSDVLAKVQAGEADAGLVYKTDAISAGNTVVAVPFPQSSEAINRNPIVALDGGKEPELGQRWVDYILSPSVQTILAQAGFGASE